MAANSFVIDPELLTQAKTYAKQAAEENMEFYNRMGTLIDQLSEAISGMGDALAGGIQNNRIGYQPENFSRRQKRLKENSQRAEALSEMIQTALDQGEVTENGLKDALETVRNFLMGLLGFQRSSGAAAPESQTLNATKAVAVSSAALAGTFGLAQLDPFTDLQKLLLKTLHQYGKLWETVIQISEEAVPKLDTATLKAQMSARYERMLKNTGRKSFNGACGAFVYQQLRDIGVFGKKDSGVPYGKDYYKTWSKKTSTSTGYKIEAYAAKNGENPLSALLANHSADEPLTNIVLSFDQAKGFYPSSAGHVMLITAIQDGQVYFMESNAGSLHQLKGNMKYAEGQPLQLSVEDFIKQYQHMNGLVHFYQDEGGTNQ